MPLLEACNVTKMFGELTALNQVSLTVGEHEVHGLIGPNGSGKSTLLKCIAGAESPTAGTIFFAGHDITEKPPEERARVGINIKFQITSVIPSLSVYDNVLLSLQAQSPLTSLIWSRTRQALHFRIMETLEHFRLAERMDECAGVLSHGEQELVEIAMALAPEPKLLLLDEPTAGMNLEERRITAELLRPIKDRCSVVIVEHDLDFIRDICDVLTVLDQGNVLDGGTVEEIQASKRVQEVYLARV
jgi:ABC-type uncharacterized transport system ATPase subunit